MFSYDRDGLIAGKTRVVAWLGESLLPADVKSLQDFERILAGILKWSELFTIFEVWSLLSVFDVNGGKEPRLLCILLDLSAVCLPFALFDLESFVIVRFCKFVSCFSFKFSILCKSFFCSLSSEDNLTFLCRARSLISFICF